MQKNHSKKFLKACLLLSIFACFGTAQVEAGTKPPKGTFAQ